MAIRTTTLSGTVHDQIDTRSVTASITAADKTYDGTDDTSITGCALNDAVAAGDGVDCVGTNGHFSTSSAGLSTVTATVGLTGAKAANYELRRPPQPRRLRRSIRRTRTSQLRRIR